MKKIFAVAIIMLALVFFFKTSPLWAGEEEGKKLTGWIIFKTDSITPASGESHWAQGLTTYTQYGNWGINVDAYYAYKSGYLEVAPYLVYNKGPLYFLAGYLTNNNSQNFVPVGIWYAGKLKGFDYFFDIRNYFGLNGAEGYSDSYLGITYPLGKKWHIGIDLEQYHYWGETNDIFMAGPLVGYKLTKNLKLCIRPTREWSGGDQTDKIRVYFLYEF